jgi:tetratricopeptide (TPR) repeat protein
MLREVAEADPRPETLSEVACELADANSYLSEAQGYAEKAVQAEESTSSQVTIDAEGTGGIENTRDLATSWDALGWVSFRRGDLAKAENYLHAAWMLAQNSSAAVHLGQVYEKEGKKPLALQMYGAAVAVNSSDTEARDHLDHVAGDRFAASGAVSAAHDRLYQLRTIHPTGAGILNGSADVAILFSKGPKVEQIRLLTSTGNLQPAEKALAQIKFDVPFPDDGPTRVVHSGNLTCGKYTGCTFVLLLFNSPH